MSEFEKLVEAYKACIEACILSSINKEIMADDPEYAEMVSEEHAKEEEAKAALLAYVAKVEGERNELKRQSLAPAVAAVCLKPSYAELQQQLAAKEALFETQPQEVADLHEALKELPQLTCELAAAREAFELFGTHRDVCGFRRGPCDCGFVQAWQAWAKPAFNRESGNG